MLQRAPNGIRAPSWVYALVFLLFFCGSVALVRDTYYQGQDFEVFWRAARHLLAGEPIYDLTRDGGMVFKYPPWIVPFFLPLGWMPLSWAKGAWGLSEVLCLFYVLKWLRAQGCTWQVWVPLTISFWGIWAVHALDGQVTLLMLALALFAGSRAQRAAFVNSCVLVLSLSTKVFSSFALLGQARLFASLKRVAGISVCLLLFSLPVAWVNQVKTPQGVFRSWTEAAVSGGQLLGGEKIRERENQGFPALALRLAGVPAVQSSADLRVALLMSLALALIWWKVSVRLEQADRWSSWLALSVVVHPLAWIHSFVLVFPAAVLATQRAIVSKNRLGMGLAFVGVASVGLLSRKTLGEPIGSFLESLSIRSIGALLCCVSLLVSRRSGSSGDALP